MEPEEAFRSAEELLSLARQSGCRYEEDIPSMEGILSALDALFDKTDAQVRAGLKEVQNAFNEKWAETPTWTFEIQVYDTCLQVGEEIFRRLEEDDGEEEAEEALGMSKDEWLEICQKATLDIEAGKKFKDVLAQNAWV